MEGVFISAAWVQSLMPVNVGFPARPKLEQRSRRVPAQCMQPWCRGADAVKLNW